MITNEIYFFKNQSSVSTSGPLYNVNDGVLILQVDGNASNLELSVLGNTDLIDDDFIVLKTINATDYSMGDKITSTGIYWIDINGIRKVKLNLSKITGSVNVKALTKRGLTTDLVARAMAANAQSGGCSLEEVKAITGELDNLSTEDKTNLVNAINEVASKGGESIYEIRPSDLNLINYMDKALVGEQITKMFADGVEDPILRVRPTSANNANINYYDFKLGRTDYPFSKKTQYYFMINPIIDITGAPIQVWNTYLQIQYISISGSWNSDNKFTCTTIRCNNVFNEKLENITTDNKVLTKTNTTSFAPTGDYNPATKKYVDDTISAKGGDKLHDYNIYTITLDDYNLKGTFPTITDTTTLAKFDEILTDIYKKRISANAAYDNAFLIVYSSSDTFIFRISTIQNSYCNLYGTYIEEPINYNGYTCSYQFNITGTLDKTAQTFKTTKVKFNRNYKRVLLTNNTLSYTPTDDYNPATKKYVDDAVGGINIPMYTITTTKSFMDGYINFETDFLNKLTELVNKNLDTGFELFVVDTYHNVFRFDIYMNTPTSDSTNVTDRLIGYGLGRDFYNKVRIFLTTYSAKDGLYTFSQVKTDGTQIVTFNNEVLTKDNTDVYTPTGDYNPATKKYVDDTITAAITTTLEGAY